VAPPGRGRLEDEVDVGTKADQEPGLGRRWHDPIVREYERALSQAIEGKVRVMEKTLTVEFGPSRSNRFAAAVAEARRVAGECAEISPGRYRVRFVLGKDPDAYASLAALLGRVKDWRATEAYLEDEPVSSYHAREMAWCASSQLRSCGGCRFRFVYGVFPRCAYCPLFDSERAIRDVLGENPPPAVGVEIRLGPTLKALLRGEELSGVEGEEPELEEVPDFVPEEWMAPPPEEPPD
jgi:hypothetical protein